MTADRARIEATIAALEAQRPLLGDAVVDVAVAPLRAALDGLAAAATDAGAQTLKQVTVLFLDVVGSTSLSQHLDPEDIHASLDGTLAACTAIVASHGGKVLQYAGDSLLAVFGAEQAREDDAERAVRAGMELLAEGRRQGERIRTAHGRDGFDVRIGAHTGGVLLGGGVDADGSIRGIAVNIAARMEQSAPAGTLRISRDTYRLVRGCFECAPQPPLDVKGIDEPVASYLVVRATPRAFVAPGRGLDVLDDARDGADGAVADGDAAVADAAAAAAPRVAMVGREAERDRVLAALVDATRTQTLRFVTIVADAGLGKSRLLLEVERRIVALPDPPRLLHGRAQRNGLHVPHGVIRDVLAWHCGILDSDAPNVAATKLTAAFGPPFGGRAAEHAALVGQLIGLDFSHDPHVAGIVQDGRQIRARAFHALGEFLRILAGAHGPIVVLLDDLHWADDGSLDLVDHLAVACRDVPLLLGCFARPALLERRPHWGDRADGSTIALQPLVAADSERLLDVLLAPLARPVPALRALILQNAEGNPFHMEELLGMLVDDGVIVVRPDGWHVDEGRLDAARVPATLTAVLQARLDALPPAERRAMQDDSVIGHVFWDDAVRAIAPDSVAALDALTRRELVRSHDTSTFAGAREYAFHHHLLHQVTYETVLKTARRTLHGKVADWLVLQTGERIREHVGAVADHYARAGRHAEAARYYLEAARNAYAGATYATALDYVERGLGLLDATALEPRLELIAVRMNAHNAMGRRQAQAADLAEFERCAEELDDDRRRAQAAQWRALLAVITGDYGAAIAAADRVAVLTGPDDDRVPLANALLSKAQALIFLGDAAAAERCLQAVLPLARAAGRRDLECVGLNRLETIAEDGGEWGVARGYLQQALCAARECGNRRFEGGLLGNLGQLEARLGKHDVARTLLQSSLDTARAIGDRGSEPYALFGLSGIVLQRGDAQTALGIAVDALAVAVDVGDRGVELDCRLLAGRCHAALGDAGAAIACFDAVDRDASTQPGGPAAIATATARAELALAEGRYRDAADHARRVVAWLDAPDNVEHRDDPHRRFVCHRALAGEPASRTLLERAHSQLMRQIGTLPEADRDAYLDVAPRRLIIAAFAARRGGAGADAG